MIMMVIQPICEIDEKARIFRICVWFSPIQPPSAVEVIAMVTSSVELSELDVRKRMVIGGNFIIVDSNRAVVMGEPWSTSGNQKWNGTNPSFIAIAVVSRRDDVGWCSWVMSHCPVDQAFVMLEKSTRAEAAACTMKYLIAASMARGWWDFEMRGMIARVLISNPAQAIIQWLLEIVIVVPRSRLKEEISFVWGFISRGRD